MSETAGRTGLRGPATAVVHESYSFACMRCGHGWEQSYEIEHHTGTDGHPFVVYVADGGVVPSPLSRPSCHNCDSHVVRIMRPGQVSSVQGAAHHQERRTPPAAAAQETDVPAVPAGGHHHWHLSDLLHPFQHRAG
ncbi:hypothetical protein ACIQKE_15065 [Streptomyces griseoviridis]|uniref:C2H2-type domain-containing protein n=2 Tax=Streptomyces TaxID=1883 RepID=A0A3Q9KXN5_STRGD|nr:MULTISPECIES: hypothetical protein [Streptomyces]AZS86746.1 hypothetical protein ELQ87_22695 [Streptomyces griseoviridis]MDH6702016.1 hypothetical protein [Streptomyces sp. MAA16]MDT0472667.1 hypothetical protein [Streptomyces sp. DSM 41014]QCN86394.1 hypothetical protein DDJ31_16570 [Streptomyces griseoviridis]